MNIYLAGRADKVLSLRGAALPCIDTYYIDNAARLFRSCPPAACVGGMMLISSRLTGGRAVLKTHEKAAALCSAITRECKRCGFEAACLDFEPPEDIWQKMRSCADILFPAPAVLPVFDSPALFLDSLPQPRRKTVYIPVSAEYISLPDIGDGPSPSFPDFGDDMFAVSRELCCELAAVPDGRHGLYAAARDTAATIALKLRALKSRGVENVIIPFDAALSMFSYDVEAMRRLFGRFSQNAVQTTGV